MQVRAAADNVLRGTSQGILLVVVHGTDDVLRKLKLTILVVPVPGLKREIFSSLTAAQKNVKTIIEKNGSFLDLGPFSVQLTRLDYMDPSHLTIAKARRRTKYALCAISEKTFGKKSVLTALVPKKPVALSVGNINIDQRVVENALVEDKNKISA